MPHISHADDDESDEDIMEDLVLAYLGWVDQFGFDFTAGNASVQGDLHFVKKRESSYFKSGLWGLNINKKTNLYLFGANAAISNGTLFSWHTCEVGLNAIYGEKKRKSHPSEELGALALTAQLKHTVPEYVLPHPVSLSCRVTYSPKAISFFDMKQFLALQLGIEAPFTKSTSLFLSYNFYDIKTSTANCRDYNTDTFEFGLAVNF